MIPVPHLNSRLSRRSPEARRLNHLPAYRLYLVLAAGLAILLALVPATTSASTQGSGHPSQGAASSQTAANSRCPGGRRNPPQPWFGVLQSSGRYLTQEARAGVSILTLEVQWNRYEPRPDTFDATYVAAQQQKLRAFCQAGFSVVLQPGLDYPPTWVFSLDHNTYYVDQYGDRFKPDQPGFAVANGVFDAAVRQAEAAYIAHLRADLCDCFYAIRIGGGQDGEITYPSADYDGHANCYWAFDTSAQAHSPVPGWIPGSPPQTQASAFWRYYVASLVDYQNWLVKTYGREFSAWLEVLYPDSGLRPGQAEYAVQNLLDGRTPAQEDGLTSVGTDFAALVDGLQSNHVIVYSTAMEEPGQGSTPLGESSVQYLETLASARHLPAAGENSGSGQSAAVMRLCVQRVRALHLAGMMWLAEPELVDPHGGAASLHDYGGAIRSITRATTSERPS